MKTVAIVAAGGVGKRLGFKTHKPFINLDGKPLILHCLNTLASSAHIDEIIVAVEASCVKRLTRLIKKYSLKKVTKIIRGGRDRFHSVRNALTAVGSSCDIILVHDAARPFITKTVIRDTVRAAARYGACVSAVPEKDTVKVAGRRSFITKTLDRRMLWRAQTPQVFRRRLIMDAYRKAPRKGPGVTDDTMLVEYLRKKVKILTGCYSNMKITTKDDLRLAEALVTIKAKRCG